MSPTADQVASTQTDPDVTDQIEQLQEAVARAQNTIRQIQNVTGTGVGSTVPAKTKGGISIPPVSGIKASVGTAVAGETQLQVTWVDAPPPTGASIDHYNVYVQSAFGAQTKPTLVGASQTSPFVGSFQPSAAVGVTVYVQTVLSNGQSLPLANCPTTAFMASKPTTSVLGLLQGYVLQTAALVSGITTPTTVLTASNGAGGGLLTIDVMIGGSALTMSVGASDIGLAITIDGSTSTQRILPASQTSPLLDPKFLNTALYRATNQNQACPYYGLGFATSLVVAIASSSSPIMSGSNVQVTVGYALHT